MTLVLLLRHAESEWNRVGRWQGRADPALTVAGREAAHAAAQRLPRVFTRVVSSPLSRAVETARILTDRLKPRTTSLDARLVERDLGPWQGMTADAAASAFPRAWQRYTGQGIEPEEWESRDVTLTRTQEALAETDDGPVLVVSHGGPIRCLLEARASRGQPVANLEGVWLIVRGGELVMLGREAFDDAAAAHRLL